MLSNQLIKALGAACGLPELEFNDKECARLLLDGTLSVQLENNPTDEIIYMYSVLCQVATHGSKEIYQQMLEDNLFGHSTRKAVLSIDKQHGDILLWRAIDAKQTRSEEMVSIFESFVEVAELWQKRLQDAHIIGNDNIRPSAELNIDIKHNAISI